jgi:hypothetical protein
VYCSATAAATSFCDTPRRWLGRALSHIRDDVVGRNSIRRATLLRRRYDLDEPTPAA